MNTRHINRVILWAVGLVVVLSCGVNRTDAQTISIDDFDDCNDDGWTRGEFPGSGGTWDPTFLQAGTCAYRLAAAEGTGTLVGASWQGDVDPVFGNGFFRATVRAETPETAILLVMREQTPFGGAYLGHFRLREQELRISAPFGGGLLARTDLEIGANEDWFMQIGAVGDQLSLKAWRVGDVEPSSPQLTATNRSFTTGGLSVGAGVSEGSPAIGGGVFDDLVFFAPERADFDNDGDVDGDDVDALVDKIVAGTNDLLFDLSADGAVNNADLGQWLSEAATTNGFASPYLLGDSNLDGSVNAIDLNNLALSWRQDNEPKWSSGDFNADGSINAVDLNELALSWQQSIPMAVSAAPIPEPSAFFLAIAGLALVWRRPKRR